MNTMKNLRDLDPARDREPSHVDWVRSTAHVERVIAGTHDVVRPVWRRPLTLGLAGAALAATMIAGISLVPGATDEAFARWTPTPGQPSNEQALPQANACTSAWQAPAPSPSDIVLAETRGVASILVLKKGNGLAECMVVGDKVFNYQALTDGPVPPLPDTQVKTETWSSSGDGDEVYSRMVGRMGPGVTRVELHLRNGQVITAGTGSGWWTAWWPGPEGGLADGSMKVVVHTADGSTSHDPGDLN
ncbi:hypothetical protein [Lentzea sp. NPDC051838]|uniref:hypothetical protein n=1 Tax=Lentzea sp. NPDC051838 TaxID=3154849 RepID=UPI00342FB023